MPKSTHVDLSRSVEDYLKAIYLLGEESGVATTTALAESLAVAAPSVSGMLRRLAELRLVSYKPYQGATLTSVGRRAALRVVRRHRLIETWLVAQLGYTWDTVHEEAERLEHAASDELVERLAAALGDPAFDPHGDPIPGTDGRFETRATLTLDQVEEGGTVVIARVESDDPDRLRWFAKHGLTPGVEVTVVERQQFDGPVTVRRGRRRQVVGGALARQLECTAGGGA